LRWLFIRSIAAIGCSKNLLIFISVTVLVHTYRKFRFSNFSYALILIFLAFHTVGAHYTYAKVPAGFWLQNWLHLTRNHYDRVIHFSFGFLLLYPMRELLVRSAHVQRQWAIWLAVAALAALSSFFEIIEAVVAQIVRPDLGAAYLGTQGDIWDAQKDMGAAFIGALIIADVGFQPLLANGHSGAVDLKLDLRLTDTGGHNLTQDLTYA
jgi:putative membrane protein